MHKIEQTGRFLGKRLGLLLKTGLPLIWIAASATDSTVHMKMFESATTTY